MDAPEFDELDGEGDSEARRQKSPVGGSWASRVQHMKHEKKSKNPFVECMDREQRLREERSWLLEEDGTYMDEKKKDMKHHRVQNRKDLANQDKDQLYANTVLYTPYSKTMMEKRLGYKIKIRLECADHGKKGKRGNANKQSESVQAGSRPPGAHQVKALRQYLESSNLSLRSEFTDDKKQKKKGAKDVLSDSLQKELKGALSGFSFSASGGKMRSSTADGPPGLLSP